VREIFSPVKLCDVIVCYVVSVDSVFSSVRETRWMSYATVCFVPLHPPGPTWSLGEGDLHKGSGLMKGKRSKAHSKGKVCTLHCHKIPTHLKKMKVIDWRLIPLVKMN